MTAMCDFVYAKGGIRFASGAATVRVTIDGVERELKVVRNGKGRSRIERGEIKLSDLESHVGPGETLAMTVHHRGVPFELQLDPRNAMGGQGRRGVKELQDTIAGMTPVGRAVLAEMQLETLPDGVQNADEARERLKWALGQSDRVNISPAATSNIAGLLDEEAAELLLAKHPNVASRIAFALAFGQSATTEAQLSPEALAVFQRAGVLRADGTLAALDGFDVDESDLAELAARGAVINDEHGLLVEAVPLSAWLMTRRGGLARTWELTNASPQGASAVRTDRDGTDHHLTARVWGLGEDKVVFGAPADSQWGSDVKVMPRNPYVLAGLDPMSAEGRQKAIEYTAAIAAVTSVGRNCMESAAGRCAVGSRCLECITDPMWSLRYAASALTGIEHGGRSADNTFVDALLYRAARGDAAAEQEFAVLAELGERMVNVQRRASQQWSVTPRMREEYKATHPNSYTLIEPMVTQATTAWRDEQLTRIASMAVNGEITPEWAEHLTAEAEKWSAERGFGTKYRDTVAGELEALKATTTPTYGYRTAEMGLDEMYFVHETEYAPQYDEAGNVVLRPAGDFNERYQRSSVHFSVNHTAEGHMFRQGDTAKHVIVVRAKELIEANPGALDCLYAIDSHLSPMPGEPLMLPANAVRTLDYASIEGAESGDGSARQETRTSRVFEVMTELQRELTGDPEARLIQFAGGPHYSTPNVDQRLYELADELGVASGIHQNLASSRIERVAPLEEMTHQTMDQTAFSVEELATMNHGARARMMTHGRWVGVGSVRAESDEDSIV